MNLRAFIFFAPLFALLPLQGYAQTAPHLGAERALERIVLEQDFGDDLKFYSREVVTIAENPKVRGLNGLMFMRWKGAEPTTEVVASVQWFEETSDLLPFYRAEKARTGCGLLPVGDTVIWKTGENSQLWTDGEHFVVGLGGSPAPPLEMLEAWLALVESNPPDLARVPTAVPQSTAGARSALSCRPLLADTVEKLGFASDTEIRGEFRLILRASGSAGQRH